MELRAQVLIRPMWLALRRALAAAALAAGCTSAPPAHEIPHQPAEDPATSILERMAETYATCKTYSDTGRATSRIGFEGRELVLHKPFRTAFKRPDRFRFASQGSFPQLGWIVWRQGHAIRSWDWNEGHERPESLAKALIEMAGVSGMASITVPKLLMPDEVRGVAVGAMVEAEQLEDEDLGGRRCHRVRGLVASHRITLWIDAETHLILLQVLEGQVESEPFEEITIYHPVIDDVLPPEALAFAAPP